MTKPTSSSSLPPLDTRPRSGRRIHLTTRGLQVLDAATRFMPLFLMAGLAVGTTWLVRQAQKVQEAPAQLAVSHAPDYEMRGFSIERYLAGAAAPSVIAGTRLLHYPDRARMVVDDARVRWMGPNGDMTTLSARVGEMSDDRSDVLLRGDARLLRISPTSAAAPMEVRGESLRFDTRQQRATSDQPVKLLQGGTTVDAASLSYDHATGVLVMNGKVQGSLRRAPGGQ